MNAISIVNNDQFQYSGGSLNDSFIGQTFTNNAGATFTLSGAGTRTVNANVTNAGTVNVTGTTAVFNGTFTNGTFTNSGALNSDSAALEFSNILQVGPTGVIVAVAGDQYILHKDFRIDPSNTLGSWTTRQADLTFTGAGPQALSFGGSDLTWNSLTVDHSAALTLDTSGKFHAGSEIIGNTAIGTLTQSSGSNVITGGLTLGSAVDALGTYDLSGGQLTTGSVVVGDAATGLTDPGTHLLTQAGGTFNQTGGTHTITGALTLSSQGSSTGAYNLSGTGILNVNTAGPNGREYVGSSGTGTFTQKGGQNSANYLYVGDSPGSNGTFEQSDGTNTITYALIVGTQAAGGGKPGATGTYNLSGGTLGAGVETIGNYGSGTFQQTGGKNTTDLLTIKAQTSGYGTYSLSGGTLNATTIVNNDQFNYSGGSLNGNVENYAGATFTLFGTGTRMVNGTVTEYYNGTVHVTGTTAIFNGTFTNYGTLSSDSATLEFLGNLTSERDASIKASLGDQYILHKDFTINPSANPANLTTSLADLTFTSAGPQSLSFGGLNLTWNSVTVDNGASLTLKATGSLSAWGEKIGDSGTGTFKQTAGTNNVTGYLTVGDQSGSTGTYDLSAGTNTIGSNMGFGDLNVGANPGSTGTYKLSGTGSLELIGPAGSHGYETVGVAGTGNFTQTGGQNTAGYLYVGWDSGSNGTFTQSGGKTTIDHELSVGTYSNGANYRSYGEYDLSDTGDPSQSVLSAWGEKIGDSGTGTFKQTGGTNTTNLLTVKADTDRPWYL